MSRDLSRAFHWLFDGRRIRRQDGVGMVLCRNVRGWFVNETFIAGTSTRSVALLSAVAAVSVRSGQFLEVVLLLPLHPTVLEPNLDLAFRQRQGVCDFDPASSGQVAVEVELLLELQCLVTGIRLSRSLLLETKICDFDATNQRLMQEYSMLYTRFI